MSLLIKDVLDIIYDYSYSIEHYHKFKASLKKINSIKYESNNVMSTRTFNNTNVIYFITLSHKYYLEEGLRCESKLLLKIFKNKKKTLLNY